MHFPAFYFAVCSHFVKRGGEVKVEILEQHIPAQGSFYAHVNRMGFIEDIQIEKGILVENILIWSGFSESVFHKTDPFTLKVDAVKAFFSTALDDLLLAYINTFNKIVALEQGAKQKDPDNEKKNSDSIFRKSQ
jgi:hypothetical protein